ncbi:hypothetical protein MHYP_G00289690 [Metynnis hypsauchen]
MKQSPGKGRNDKSKTNTSRGIQKGLRLKTNVRKQTMVNTRKPTKQRRSLRKVREKQYFAMRYDAFCHSYVNNMIIRQLPLEDYRPRICMKRTARVETVYMELLTAHSPVTAAEEILHIQESLALKSEEDFSSSDESGEDSEEERLYFEKRIDLKEDFCNR